MSSLLKKQPLSLLSRVTFKLEWRAVILDGIYGGCVIAFVVYVGRKSIGLTETHLSFIFASMFLGMLISVFLPSLFPKRTKMFYYIMAGIIGKTVTFALPFTQDKTLFTLIGCVVCGAPALGVPAYTGIIKMNYPGFRRASILGMVNAVKLSAMALGAFATGRLLDYNADLYKIVFPLAAALGFASMFVYSRIPVKGERAASTLVNGRSVKPMQIFEVLKHDRLFRNYEILFFINGMSNIMGLQLYVIFITDVLNANYSQIGLITGVLAQISMIVTYPIWGKVMDRFPNPFMQRAIVGTLWTLQPLVYVIAGDIRLIFAVTVFLGLVQSGGLLNWALSATYFSKRRNVMAYAGAHNFLCGVRGIIGPFISLTLFSVLSHLTTRETGLRLTFLFNACLMLFSGLAMFLLDHSVRKANERKSETPAAPAKA